MQLCTSHTCVLKMLVCPALVLRSALVICLEAMHNDVLAQALVLRVSWLSQVVCNCILTR